MKHILGSQFLAKRGLDLVIGGSALLLLLNGCFAHKADVSESSDGSSAITASPALTSAPYVPLSSLKAMKSLAGSTLISIDVLHQAGAKDIVIAGRPPTAEIAKEKASLINGWAIDNAAHRSARAVFVTIDGRSVSSCMVSTARPDVATALGNPDYKISGWACTIPSGALLAGRHALGLKVAVQDGHAFYTVPWPTELVAR